MTTTNDQEEQFPADGRRTPLGAHLIAAGLATRVQVERALEEQRQTGKRLGGILIGHGVLYEADLASALATMFELPYRDLSLDPPDPAALDQIPQAFCWSRGVLPIGFQDNAVVVAIGDPHDIQTIDDLTMMTSAPVRIVVVAPSQLRQAIEQGYQTMDLIVESDDPSAGKSDLPRPSDDPRIGDVPNIDVSPDVDLSQGEGPVITFVNQLLRRAVDERASDLHLEPTREGLRVRFRVDGILHDVTDAPPSLQAGILSRVKIMTGMDIADHRRPQDGRVSMVAHGLSVDIRAASLPTIYGNSWFCDCSKRTRACWISPDWASRLMP